MQIHLLLTLLLYIGYTQWMVTGLLLRPPYYFSEISGEHQKGKGKEEEFGMIEEVATENENENEDVWLKIKAKGKQYISKSIASHFKSIEKQRKIPRRLKN